LHRIFLLLLVDHISLLSQNKILCILFLHLHIFAPIAFASLQKFIHIIAFLVTTSFLWSCCQSIVITMPSITCSFPIHEDGFTENSVWMSVPPRGPKSEQTKERKFAFLTKKCKQNGLLFSTQIEFN